MRSGPSPWIQDPLLVRHKSPPKKMTSKYFKHSSGLSNHPPSIMIPLSSSTIIIHHHQPSSTIICSKIGCSNFPPSIFPNPLGAPAMAGTASGAATGAMGRERLRKELRDVPRSGVGRVRRATMFHVPWSKHGRCPYLGSSINT